MRNLIVELSENHIFVAVLLGWAIAQGTKVFLGVVTERRFNFKWFVDIGGMPSSHAATVSALATAVGLKYGVKSSLFAVTLTFAWIVLMDAQGFRRSAGKQAEALNKILDDIYWKKQIGEERLKELLGHTPFEVLMGTIIGMLTAMNIILRT